MANAMYPLGRQKFLEGLISWSSHDIKLVLVEGGYVYDDAHEFRDDLTDVIATSANLAGKTTTFGVADADDVIFTALATGPAIEGLVLFRDTGVPATSPLFLFLDSTTASVEISTTPDGSNVRVRWSDGPLRIFRL